MSALTFSGHETFHCRNYWLKKGFDFIQAGNSFRDKDAVIKLGVGKNMVSSIRFWLHAFGLLQQEETSEVAAFIFGENGVDPFLENPSTLWLLHYLLVKSNYASIYELVFNQIKGERSEFSREFILQQIQALLAKGNKSISPKTLENDIKTFRKNYVRPSKVKDVEDDLSALLIDLNLVRETGDKSIQDRSFIIESGEKPEIPYELILFAIIENHPNQIAVPFQDILNGELGAGRIFALNAAGLMDKIEEITEQYPSILYSSDGGIQQIMFTDDTIKAEPMKILRAIYD